jgi:membrane-associated phospholipid phosphatase
MSARVAHTTSEGPAFAAVSIRTAPVTDTLLWRFVAFLVVADSIAAWRLGWTVVWSSARPLFAGIAFFAVLGAFYRWSGRSDALARLGHAVALGLALAYACLVTTFVLGVTGAPFQDQWLVRADAAIGFDWASWVAWLDRHPPLRTGLMLLYPLHTLETGTAIGLLALTTSRGAPRFLRAFALCFLVACGGLLACPALGHIPEALSVPVRLGLRAGTWTTLHFGHLPGIISMPSMHAALAVLTTLACWHLRAIRWPLAFINAAMVIATVSEGGHYLVDVIAGVAIAVVAFRLAGKSLEAQAVTLG